MRHRLGGIELLEPRVMRELRKLADHRPRRVRDREAVGLVKHRITHADQVAIRPFRLPLKHLKVAQLGDDRAILASHEAIKQFG